MKQPLLVIFVDALPYDRAISMVNSLNAKTYSKSVPGAGYSINVKAEMFAGLKPDDVGYFCEWNYDADASVSWPVRALMPVLEFLGGISHFADRVFHKLITKALGENVYAIPYRVLPFLKNSGLTAYERDFQCDLRNHFGSIHALWCRELQCKLRTARASKRVCFLIYSIHAQVYRTYTDVNGI